MAVKNKYVLEFTSQGVNRTKSDVDKLGKSQGILSKNMGKLKAGAVIAGTAIVSMGVYAIKTAGQFQTLQTRLNTMYGSVNKGSKAFREFVKVASTTPFAVKSVVEAGASLKAFGMDAEANIKGVADLAAFMGVDVTEAAQAMGRAFAGGAGAADVLRERGVIELIKSFKGIDDITKLTLPQFRTALIDAMQDPQMGISGSTDALAETFEGNMSNMMDAIDRLAASMGDKLLPIATEATKFMQGFANSIADHDSVYEQQIADLRSQSFELRILQETLNGAEKGTKLYNDTLATLRKKYPDLLTHLGNHETGLNNINKAIDETIELTEKRIKLIRQEAMNQAAQESQTEATKEFFKSQMDLAESFADQGTKLQDLTTKILSHTGATEKSAAWYKEMKKAMKDLEDAEKAYIKGDGNLETYYKASQDASEVFLKTLGEVQWDEFLSPAGFLDIFQQGDLALEINSLKSSMGALTEDFETVDGVTSTYNKTMEIFARKIMEGKTLSKELEDQINAEIKKKQELAEQNKKTSGTTTSETTVKTTIAMIPKMELGPEFNDSLLRLKNQAETQLKDLSRKMQDTKLVLEMETDPDKKAELQADIDQFEVDVQALKDNIENIGPIGPTVVPIGEDVLKSVQDYINLHTHFKKENEDYTPMSFFGTPDDEGDTSETAGEPSESVTSMVPGLDTEGMREGVLAGLEEVKLGWLEGMVALQEELVELNLLDVLTGGTDEQREEKKLLILEQLEAIKNGIETIEQVTEEVATNSTGTLGKLAKGFGKAMTTIAKDENKIIATTIEGANALIGAGGMGKKKEIMMQKAMVKAGAAKGLIDIWATEGWSAGQIAKKVALSAVLIGKASQSNQELNKALADLDKEQGGGNAGFSKQYGMNEIVDTATPIIAGEAGAELVQITPLEGENVSGAGGNITITGNVMSKDFVEDELVAQLREATRRGHEFR
jgi:hypothetical protein